MKILHIIPTLSSGGAEKMLVDIVREMQKQKIQCEVIVLTKNDNFFGEQLEALNVPVYYGPSNKVYSVSNIQFIRSILLQNKFDCIHTHLFAPQLFTPLAMFLSTCNVSLITTEHNTHNKRRDSKMFYLLDRWMYNQYDAIIAISDGTKNQLNEYLPNTMSKTVVIENGIQVEHYKNMKPLPFDKIDRSLKVNEKIILMVAAMREQKDHETLIRASQLLPEDYRVVFVGDGERFDEVKQYAVVNGRENIIFLGRRSDVPAIMASSDLFVLSSKWEGFGLVVVEAAATGLPIVSSNVDGLREVVYEIGGSLFEPGNEKELATKIIESISVEKKNNLNVKKYSIEKTVTSYVEVYEKLLEKEKNN